MAASRSNCSGGRNTGTTNSPDFLVLDVDGTLLTSSGELSPRNRTAIGRAQNKGATVMLATGKTPSAIRWLHAALGLDTPMVCIQGALLCSPQGQVLSSRVLPAELALRVIHFAGELGFEVVAYAGNDIHVVARTNRVRSLETRYGEPKAIESTDLAGLARSNMINKLLLLFEGAVPPELRSAVAVRLGTGGSLIQAVSDSVEVLPDGVNKAEGVSAVLEQFGARFGSVLAVGDGENDLELLARSATGIAVANAAAPVLRIADLVVGTNDQDGVAQAVEVYWP